MKVKIKRFDKTIAMPVYKSPGAVAVDLAARETVRIAAGEVGYIPLNIGLQLPKGYWAMIVSRGSTHKLGLMMANSVAVGDEDFCGDGDEYMFPAFNFTKKEVVIEKGTRMAQLMVNKYERIEFEEVDHLKNKDRGKFASTGFK